MSGAADITLAGTAATFVGSITIDGERAGRVSALEFDDFASEITLIRGDSRVLPEGEPFPITSFRGDVLADSLVLAFDLVLADGTQCLMDAHEGTLTMTRVTGSSRDGEVAGRFDFVATLPGTRPGPRLR